MKLFKAIVAGGRDFNDAGLMVGRLDYFLSSKSGCTKISIISGMAKGADTLGASYAEVRGYLVWPYPANWELHGKSAGYKRNQEMAEVADVLVAFWDGKSRGTKHMIDIMRKLNKPVRVVKY